MSTRVRRLNNAISNFIRITQSLGQPLCMIFFFLMGLIAPVQGQTPFWSDDFEASGSPSSGTRTPELENNTGSDAYFGRSEDAGANTLIINGNAISYSDYSGESGSQFWAGENHDGITGNSQSELEIVWTGINITGRTNMRFAGLFAAASNGPFETDDEIFVEYRINGGSWTQGLRIEKIGGGSGDDDWAVDTDNDGDGDSPTLTETFQQLTFAISGTGTTLDIRIRVDANATDEEWAIDNFRLVECATLTPTITKTETSGNSNNDGIICNGASVTLDAGSYTTYAWSTTATTQTINVNPASTTTYTVTVTNSFGCTGTASTTITVNSNPSANITFTESSAGTNNDGTICSAAAVTLDAGVGFTVYA